MSIRTVVVGSGSAGGVVAARLSEDPGQDVVLIEAGRDYPRFEGMPESIRNAQEGITAEHDWGMCAQLVEPADIRPPQSYGRGRVVGGSSSVNQCLAQRATTADAQRWVSAGLTDWSWDKLLEYYKKLESDQDFGETDIHGGSGPVPVRRDFGPSWEPVGHAMQAVAEQFGFPVVDDLLAPGAYGFGPAARSVGPGAARMGTLMAYLRPARNRPNLKIMAETVCRRVVFEGTRAVGVEVIHGDRSEVVAADRVVLSAGSFKSPQLLTLSGIGPAQTLEGLGITPIVVNENVGRNMRDHAIVIILGRDSQGSTPAPPQLVRTTPTGARMGLFNDVITYAAIGDPRGFGFPMASGTGAVAMVLKLWRPTSAGWLEVRSTDVEDQPAIHSNLLGTEEDMVRMIEEVRHCLRLAGTEPFAGEFQPVVQPTAEVAADDVELAEWIRRTTVPALHATSTCRMGVEPETSVVSQRLAVHGTENLFVADASVLHDVPSAAPNLTCMLVGERLADWLLDPA